MPAVQERIRFQRGRAPLLESFRLMLAVTKGTSPCVSSVLGRWTLTIFIEFVPPDTPENSPFVTMMRSPSAASPSAIMRSKIAAYICSGRGCVTSKSTG